MVSRSQLWSYGLAFLGAHLAFMPLLVLLLPRRVEALFPEAAAVTLSLLLLTGGVVAGLSNIAAGAISDRWMVRFGNRRGLIAIGAGLLLTAYLCLAFASSNSALFISVIYFQIALNCCFAPLGVLLADHFPDEVKGRLSGISNAALPTSTLLVAPIAWAFPEDHPGAFLLVGGVSVLCMLPLLISWRMGQAIAGDTSGDTASLGDEATASAHRARDFSLAWTARLLVQTGAAFAIGYIYLYIQDTGIGEGAWENAGASEILAALTAPAAGLAIAATLLGGLVSDWKSARRVPLMISASLFGIGLGMLAFLPQLGWFFIAYGLVQIGLSAFLSVDTALVAQLVGGSSRRGLLLGLMNLSNTLPSVIAPSIALLALGAEDVSGALPTLFAGFAVAAFVSGILMLFIRSVR